MAETIGGQRPKRIQRKRTKGWKMPPNTISVTRPGRYGNPFKIGNYVKLGKGEAGLMYLICLEAKYATPAYVLLETTEQAVEMYREFRRRYPLPADWQEELRGKDLACWCKEGSPCHADVLLEIANA